MAPVPLTPPPLSPSRFATASPSLEGLERIYHTRPQPSPNKSTFSESQESSTSYLNKPLPPSRGSSGRPSFSSSRKSSSSAVNKPLPPSPPAPLFSPRHSHQVSPQSRSPGTLSGRGPTPQSAGFKPPPPFNAVNVPLPAKTDSYPGRPEFPRAPSLGTPLLAPSAQVSLAPSMQEERLQAFETFATFTPLELSTLFSEHVPQSEGQLQAIPLHASGSRKQSVPYRFDTTADETQGSQGSLVRPAWASEAEMSLEHVAAEYRQTLPPSPFVTTEGFDIFEDGEDTPTRPRLPLLPATSYFTPRRDGGEDGILTSTVLSAAADLSIVRRPLSARHSAATSHEESYRASRLDTPNLTPRAPAQAFLSPPSDHDSSRQSSVDKGAPGSQASWERGDDQSFMRDDTVSPLEDGYIVSSFETSLRPEDISPQLLEWTAAQLLQPSVVGPSPKSIPRLPRTPILKALDPVPKDRQSALQLNTTAAAFTSLTSSTDPRSSINANAAVSASSEYTDDIPSSAPMSRFSDDSDTEEKKKNRRSNPLTHLRKALGHRKTDSVSSSGSHKAGTAAQSTPISPKPAKTAQHVRGQSLGKMGEVAAQRIDDQLGDMYETLSRFSWDASAGKGKGKERESHRVSKLPGPRQKMDAGGPETPETPGLPTSASKARPPGHGASKLKTGTAKFRKRSDTVIENSPRTPSSPATKWSTRSPIKSPTWRRLTGEDNEDGDRDRGDEGRSEGWLARRRRKKDEAKKEKWREDMKSRIKVVSGEPQGMMAIVATRNRNLMDGGML